MTVVVGAQRLLCLCAEGSHVIEQKMWDGRRRRAISIEQLIEIAPLLTKDTRKTLILEVLDKENLTPRQRAILERMFYE